MASPYRTQIRLHKTMLLLLLLMLSVGMFQTVGLFCVGVHAMWYRDFTVGVSSIAAMLVVLGYFGLLGHRMRSTDKCERFLWNWRLTKTPKG